MRAITKNTRRVTALTLAAALVVAVYLNWQYARTGIGVDEEAVNVSAVAVEGEPVASPVTDGLMTEAEAVSSANKNYGEAQLVSVANDAGAKFFEEARLKRQKAHDEAMDTIQKTLKTSGLSAEEKKDCTRQMTANLEDLNAENEIETLVKAKGFAVRPGRPDRHDLRRRPDRGTGGPDKRHRPQQERGDCAEYYCGGSEVRCCIKPEKMV